MSYLAARPPGAAAMQQALNAAAPDGLEQAHRLVQAEVETARALEQLGPGWQVLHSVPVGPGPATLAHLLIGPQGVFALSSLSSTATVVDVQDGQARLSPYGCQNAVAEVRQLAQRVRAGWVHRLGRAVDLPAVHPVVCLTAGGRASAPKPGEHVEVVELSALVTYALHHQRRLTAVWVERLAALSSEPLTWDAPGVECFDQDLQARYDALVTSEHRLPMAAADSAASDDTVITGSVISSQPPRLAAEGPAVRATSVLMVACGIASLGTFGVLSPPGLVLGGVTLRHHGGLRWLNDKDANLFLVGIVMTVLPLPILFFLLLAIGAARVQ